MNTKSITTAAAVALLLWVGGCTESSRMMPMPGDLIAGGVVASDTDPRSLRRGRALAVTACTQCHRLYWPGEQPPEVWRRLGRDMASRASLSARQTEDLMLYVEAASRATTHTPTEGAP